MLKQLSFILVAILAIAITAQADTWDFDKSHSTIGFTAQHMLISHVAGKFEDFSGQVMFDGKDLTKGSVEVNIDVNSINTDNDRRNNHLRSSDFFDIANYPTMTFKSTKITMVDDKHFQMTGDLTIKGITKPVTLDCTLNGIITDPMGNTRAGFSATGMIHRHDFNIAWDNKLQDGSYIVGEDIDINLQIEITKEVAK
jgi:polyisoprenoid-binding protein YceI